MAYDWVKRRGNLNLTMAGNREEIVRVISDVVAPLVRADGGKVYLVRADDDRVALHVAGSYSGCPGNTLATRHIIEPAIYAVAPNAQVVVTSGILVPEGAELIDP